MIRRMLRKERTDYGRQMRNKYESGEFWDSRHNMTVHAIRPDELSNTLSTVLKDNLLIEIHGVDEPKGSDNLTNINEGRAVAFEGKPFNYVSLFSGIGGFEQALNKLGGTCVMASEIDKYANQAYEILYGHSTVGDVTKVAAEDVPDHDLLVGGFPCQAFSVAGKRLGFEEARGTLFFEIARIAKVKQPKAMMLENVKGLVGHDGGKTLDTIIQTLDEIGYTVDFEVMNSKYFGVPQNRERIFIVAVRNDLIEPSAWNVGKRSDVVAKGKKRIAQLGDDNRKVKTFNFDWPAQTEVTVRLRDILESDVDEKFYLSEEKTAKLVAQLEDRGLGGQTALIDPKQAKREGVPRFYTDVAPTVTARDYKEPNMIGIKEVAKLYEHRHTSLVNSSLSTEGISPALDTMSGGSREPKIAIEQFSQGEGVSCCIDANYTKGTAPGDVGKGRRTHVVEDIRIIADDGLNRKARERRDGITSPLRAVAGDRPGTWVSEPPKYRIRKLTPKECFRLQGFPDAEFDKLTANGLSNSQLYKMAGNAVTVNVIDALGKRLLPYLGGEQK